MPRQPKAIGATGTTGAGKSKFIKDFAIKQAKKNGDKILVVTYSGKHDTWADFKKMEATPEAIQKFKASKKAKYRQLVWQDLEKETLMNVYNNFSKGILILDDCQMYLPSNWDHDKGFKGLMVDSRPLELDIFLVAHGMKHIPVKAWEIIKYYLIFKGKLPPTRFRSEFDNFDRIVALQKDVNKEYKQKKNNGEFFYGLKRIVEM